MKKTIIIALVALTTGFASCKKDRTCTCTYFKPWASSSETQVTTYDHVTKKSAAATCTSGNTYDAGNPSNVETRTCTLN